MKHSAFLIIFLFSSKLLSAPILDQFYDHVDENGGKSVSLIDINQSIGQSFTVGTKGVLSQIEINVTRGSSIRNGDGPINFQLTTLNSFGLPDEGNILANINLFDIPLVRFEPFINLITISETQDYYSINLALFNINVDIGDQLAFLLSSPTNTVFVAYGGLHYEDGLTFDGLGYLGGIGFESNDNGNWTKDTSSYNGRTYSIDNNFKTFVTPNTIPEPSSFLLLIIGCIGLLITQKQIRKEQVYTA